MYLGISQIKKKTVFKLGEINCGQEVSLSFLKDNEFLTKLHFTGRKEQITVEELATLEEKNKILKQLIEIANDIRKTKKGKYLEKEFLFVCTEEECKLGNVLDYSKGPLGYGETKKTATDLGLNLVKPVWTGKYFPDLENYFLEDLLIQKV